MSGRLTLYFEPLDVLQFRDYRPFDAGYNVLGQSVFPLPGVFLGCVRAALFRDAGADFSKKRDPYFGVKDDWARALLGSSARVGSLQLRGPLVARREDRDEGKEKTTTLHPYFPMPADLVAIKNEDQKSDANPRDRPLYTVLAPRSADRPDDPRFYHRRPGKHGADEAAMDRSMAPALPWTHHELGKPRGGTLLLTEDGARKYAEATHAKEPFALELDEHAVRQDEILLTENRFGIARSPDTLTVEQKMFYLQRPYRLRRDHGFAVEVSLPGGEHAARAEQAIRNLDGRIVQLGGRGHRARVTVCDQGLVPDDIASPAGPVSKRWFLTPAPLCPGLDAWPAGMTVVTERVQAIGGFDQAKRRPRPLLRALPAGTIVHVDAQRMHAVETELCGFSRGATSDDKSELTRELERLQHAGFAMALPVGAGRGE